MSTSAYPLVLFDDVAPNQHGDELAAAGADRGAGDVGQLPFVDPERRALADLPSDQLVEILRAGRDGIEPDDRHAGGRVRYHEPDALRPDTRPIHCASQRAGNRLGIADIGMRQTRCDDPLGERLRRGSGHDSLSSLLTDRDDGHPARGDLHGMRRPR